MLETIEHFEYGMNARNAVASSMCSFSETNNFTFQRRNTQRRIPIDLATLWLRCWYYLWSTTFDIVTIIHLKFHWKVFSSRFSKAIWGSECVCAISNFHFGHKIKFNRIPLLVHFVATCIGCHKNELSSVWSS